MEAVAALAGVSTITVSRVLSRPEKVSAATRAKVLAAVNKTGFVLNLAAGTLASKKSRIIAAVVPTLSNAIFAETIRGLSDGLAPSGYQLLLGQSNYDPETEETLVSTFLGRQVDALVLTGGRHTERVRTRLRLSKIPVVETWDLPAKPIDMVVGFSNLEAGCAVGRHLLARGYRKIDFAGGPDDRSLARIAGLRSVLDATKGATIRVHELAAGGGFPAGAALVARLHEAQDMPRAIFFGNDALAAGALFECQRRGVKIPQMLALIGFADLEFAAALNPPLSTVSVPSAAMGQATASLLLNRLAAPNTSATDAAKIGGTKSQKRSTTLDLGFKLQIRASS
jgi:LacI family transcriptional regulator, gluconate utilization system Gnt-I transcriptional repressor